MAAVRVVRDFTIGNTQIKISDDCCQPFEVERLLKKIAGQAHYQFLAAAKETERADT